MKIKESILRYLLKGYKPTTYFRNDGSAVIGDGITFYPSDSGEKYIDKGYKLNDAVFSIVSRNAEKASQVRLYHAKVKKNEKHLKEEYELLQKGAIDAYKLKELKKLQKAMTEDLEVKSDLAKLLDKPNRNQSQSEFIESLVGLRELQGEGNTWLTKGLDGKKILEMLVIPKPHLQIIGNNNNPWEIIGYVFDLNGTQFRWEKDEVMMWKYANPSSIDLTFEHLRGMAPLKAFEIQLQAMNEADRRMASANNNAGASGLLYRKDAKEIPNDKAIADGIRAQIDNTINASQLAGKIAWLAGEWDYLQFGRSIDELKILDQYTLGFKRLCRVFKTPPGIFEEGNDTYENQRQYERKWIYSKIAPMMYQLRGILSDYLIPAFGLNPETDLIDCDVTSLPELTQDLKEMTAALKDATWLTENEKRDACGYEPKDNPIMDMTDREMGEHIGGGLDNELNALT